MMSRLVLSRLALMCLENQREERELAAFTAVVGRRMKTTYLMLTTMISAHRMSDRTPNTFSGVRGQTVLLLEAFLDGVKRAGADVTIHDAYGEQRQLRQAVAGGV